jgi:zinc and cadmium transporter
MTEPFTLLLGYSVAIALASVAGGALPNRVRMTHTRTQLAMSLVSGLMLGVAFFHLLPHAIVMDGSPQAVDHASVWLLAGLVAMFLLLRTFHFHQHEFEPPAAGQAPPASGVHGISGAGIAFGLGLHTVIDGVALGAAVSSGHGGGMLGAGVFLAVLLHKPLDALSITALMRSGGWSSAATGRVNLAFAALCPAAAILFYLSLAGFPGHPPQLLAAALAFAAGAFVCIALSDLLPEVHFHSHDRVKLTLVFLAGIGLAWLIGGFEPAEAHRLALPELHRP